MKPAFDSPRAAARTLAFALGGAVALAAAVLAPSSAAAQDYPTRPVKIVVPFSPGGAVDGPTRIIAQKLSERLGQQVIVENKPGAGATIGADVVAKSAPDGYTLLLASQTVAISATLYKKLPYDPLGDFTPIMLIGREPGVLVVHPSFPANTFPEFLAYVKAHPGEVDFASSGNGSGQHLFAAMLASMAGLKMNHIPYKGSGQATADVLAGQVKVSIPGTAGMMGHIKAGKLRPLATTGAKRAAQLPDVQTVGETLPGYEAYVWMGLFAPTGTPAPIIERLNKEILAVLPAPEVQTYMANAGIEIVGSTPEQFGKFFLDEKDRWAKIIRESGAKID